MRPTISLAAGACVLALSIAAVPAAAQGQPQAAARAQGGGGGRGRGPATFPAQQRPPGDPVLIERGHGLYDINCRLCHGADLRGGDMGGPNLLRSQLVLNDQLGELIGPIILGGSETAGMGTMPPIPLPDDDVRALAEYLHSVQATMRRQGNPPAGEEAELNVLVGDAAAGQEYFNSTCTSCHTAADMCGIGSRIPDAMDVQNYWISGGVSSGRGGGGSQAPAAVTVTLLSGQKYEGELVRYDDFVVALRQADGKQRSFRRRGGEPSVEIDEPGTAHRQLLPSYTDKNIHDVTAYMVTFK